MLFIVLFWAAVRRTRNGSWR
uniref:Uncharacterized protein n=1 Tax=Arundo donax TaxID=35708 RepID=A0A0A9GD84_ARUDO